MSEKQRETRSKIPESARTGSKLNLQIKTYDPSNSFIVSLCLFLALFAVLWFCVHIKLNSMGMLTYFLSPIYALILLCHLLVHFSAIRKGTKKADKTPLIHRSLISHGFLIISFMGGCDTGFGSGYCTLDAVFSELEPHGSTNIPGWLPWSANVPGWLPWFFLLGFPFLIVSWWALYKLGRPQAPTELTNLAALYKATGRYAEAEPLYKQSLVIAEKALGPEHPGVAWKLQGLAGLYADQGRYADAEPLYKRALVIRVKALGPNHPDVGLSLNSIAVLYDRQGRREAE